MLMDVFPLVQPEPPISIDMNRIVIQHKITSWLHADENISHEFKLE
nr:MAG TPA: YnbE-like lipoprotein [Caudoviricetes sp.]